MFQSKLDWTLLYTLFYAVALGSLAMSAVGLHKMNGIDAICTDCPNGADGENGEDAFCSCCPFGRGLSLTNTIMLWTQGNTIAGTITQGNGWLFTNQRAFGPGTQTDSYPNVSIANFPYGIWQVTYEISLQVGTTLVLLENFTSGTNFTDINTLAGSNQLQTWISGLTIENVTEASAGYMLSTLSANARAVLPGPSTGFPLVRVIAIQYSN